MGIWFVPLASVLDTHGLAHIKSYAYATGGISAFISPLIFGALADRHIAPVRLLRWLSLATAIAMALATTAIHFHWSAAIILVLIQLHALCATPTWSISTTIVLAKLNNPKREFGPIRAMATLGWIVGCLLVSALHADSSTFAGYGGVLAWLVVTAFTFALPSVAPPAQTEHLSWKQRLGLDALSLLKHRDTCVVFIAAALYNMPLCAFFPQTPLHMKSLGLHSTTAWMSLGQVTEVVAMFSLAGLLARWRMKTVILAGMSFGVLRFVLCALDTKGWLLGGVALHGLSFVLVYITFQLYLEQRIDPRWRARAQALLTLLLSGFGNLFGYLGCGWWFKANTHGEITRWPLYWGGLAACVTAVWIFFAIAYKGRAASEEGKSAA